MSKNIQIRPKQPHGNTDTGIMDMNSPDFWRNAYSNDKITQPFVNTKRRDSYRHLDQEKYFFSIFSFFFRNIFLNIYKDESSTGIRT